MWLERYKQSSNFDLEEIKQYWCTSFALQRAYEGSGYKYKFFKDRAIGGFPNANNWYSQTCLPTGNEARVGAIACWSGGEYGHVAYVEDCNGNHIKISQATSKTTFKITEHDVEVGQTNNELGSGYIFQGFIYTPINDIRVERNESKNQVLVKCDALRVREKPNGNYIGGLMCPKGVYDIQAHQIINDVLWVELEPNSWIMTNDEWTEIYTGETSEMKDLDELIDELETIVLIIKDKIKIFENQVAENEKDLKIANEKLEKIKNIL